MTPPLVVLATALLVAGAGAALTPWARGLAGHPSRWLHRGRVAGLGTLTGAGVGLLATGWTELLAFAVLGVGAALLVSIDLAVQRLPDALVGPLYPLLLGLLGLAAALEGDGARWARAALGGGLLVLLYLALALARPADLGVGDIKLAGLLGVFMGWLGWSELVLGALSAFVVGALVASLLLLARRATRRTDLPFGPCMVAGAAVGAALGPVLLPALG